VVADTRHREEVLNVELAHVLDDLGVVAAPEQIDRVRRGQGRRLPDVTVVDHQGLRTTIEGKFAGAGADAAVLGQAHQRVEEGIAHIALAVVYPVRLRTVPFRDLADEMGRATFRMAAITEASEGEWVEGGATEIAALLRRGFADLLREDVVADATVILEAGVDEFSTALLRTGGASERVAAVLSGDATSPSGPRKDAELRASASIAGLVVFNALIFHEILASADRRVGALLQVERSADPVSSLVATWALIEREIDYVPIFRVARSILEELASGDIDEAIRELCHGAREVVRKRAALRHDLMGRVYHRLLLDAKYLATYYTSVPAATILSKLVFSPRRTQVDWSKPDAIREIRIADLACGTGTLLMAASEAVTDNHVRAAADAGLEPSLADVHRILLEDAIYGYDVLPTALHLTASTLALRASTTAFDHTNLHCMPLGGASRSLGSVEFLERRKANAPMVLFRQGVRIRGQQGAAHGFAELPDLDFCLMNPPFARSVVGNLLFGSVPTADRRALQNRLARMLRDTQAEASSTAGLGAVFVAVADTAIKRGGRLGLVLSKALLSGVAWAPTRELLARDYAVECVIVSQDPTRWNFSENTHLSEALLVAQKTADATDDPQRDDDVVFVNLWRNPRTVFEALLTAQGIISGQPPSLEAGQGAQAIRVGEQKIGEAFRVPRSRLTGGYWGLCSSYAQTDLARTASFLVDGRVRLPGVQGETPIALVRLGDLGTLGPDVRDIHDAFTRASSPTQYRAHWGHESNDVQTIAREANVYLDARGAAAEGRHLRDADLMWSRAGRIMVTARLRLNTYRLAAVLLPIRALGSGWWPLHVSDDLDDRAHKAIVLWLNSTLGLLTLLATRVDTEGAWTQFKKPNLEEMMVLDPRSLEDDQLTRLARTFDEIASEPVGRFPDMGTDRVRDVIDTALASTLGLPPLGDLRSLLGQEPVICLGSLG